MFEFWTRQEYRTRNIEHRMMKYARAQGVCTLTIRGILKTLNLELPVKTETSSFLVRRSIFGVQCVNLKHRTSKLRHP
jgi:hypothetical protein